MFCLGNDDRSHCLDKIKIEKLIKFGEILFGFFKQKLSGKISRQQGLVIFEIPTWRPLEIKCYARR